MKYSITTILELKVRNGKKEGHVPRSLDKCNIYPDNVDGRTKTNTPGRDSGTSCSNVDSGVASQEEDEHEANSPNHETLKTEDAKNNRISRNNHEIRNNSDLKEEKKR